MNRIGSTWEVGEGIQVIVFDYMDRIYNKHKTLLLICHLLSRPASRTCKENSIHGTRMGASV